MNLLLVDDETLVREWFSSTVKDFGPDYKLIGTVSDAFQALEILKSADVDLIFIDIKMPGIDGLELLAQISSLYPKLAVVMLSAFAEFQYARTAMKNGANDYLLKGEITKESLKAKIDEIKDEVKDEEINQKAIHPLYKLFDKSEWDSKLLSTISLQNKPSYICFINIDDPKVLSEYTSEITDILNRNSKFVSFFFKLNLNLVIGLISKNKNSKELQNTDTEVLSELKRLSLRIEYDTLCRIGISTKGESDFNPPESLKTAFLALIESYLCLEPVITETKKNNDSNSLIWYPFRNFTAAIDRLDFDSAQLFCQQILNSYSELSNTELAFLLYSIGSRFNLPSRNISLSSIIKFWEVIHHKNGLSESSIRELLNLLIDKEHKATLKKNNKSLENKNPINLAIQYINDNFYTDLSLQNMAEITGLNPSYFSEKFHNICGETFSDMVSRLRINKAKDLFENSSLSIRRIGELIGYTNPSYFNQIFQKHCGITPGTYRKKIKET